MREAGPTLPSASYTEDAVWGYISLPHPILRVWLRPYLDKSGPRLEEAGSPSTGVTW